MSIANILAGATTFTQYAHTFGPTGSGSSLTFPSSTSLNIGQSGDYTVECWARPTATASFRTIASIDLAGASVLRLETVWNFSIANLSVTAATLPLPELNKWFHFSVTRTLGSVYVHINGVQYASAVNNTTNISFNGVNGRATVGRYNNSGNQEWLGQISQFRVSRIARYTLGQNYIPSLYLPADFWTLCHICGAPNFNDAGPLNLGAFTQVGTPSPTATTFSVYRQ